MKNQTEMDAQIAKRIHPQISPLRVISFVSIEFEPMVTLHTFSSLTREIWLALKAIHRNEGKPVVNWLLLKSINDSFTVTI